MSRESFHESLEQIELELLTHGGAGGDVGPAIRRGARAARRRLAQTVIDDDDAIDELYLKIDSDVLSSCWRCSPRSRRTSGWSRRSCTAASTWSGSATRR